MFLSQNHCDGGVGDNIESMKPVRASRKTYLVPFVIDTPGTIFMNLSASQDALRLHDITGCVLLGTVQIIIIIIKRHEQVQSCAYANYHVPF